MMLDNEYIAALHKNLFQLRNPELKVVIMRNFDVVFFDRPLHGKEDLLYAVPDWARDARLTNHLVVDYDLNTEVKNTRTKAGSVWTVSVKTKVGAKRVAVSCEGLELSHNDKLRMLQQTIVRCALEVARECESAGLPQIKDHAHL